MIQQAVKTTAGEDKVAVNVNADEAAVLGAGLYGAGLSRQFKTKDIKVSDVCMYDIQASYATVPKDGGSPKTITSTIFPPNSKTGSKKTLTFKRKTDFSVKLLYKKTPFVCVLMIQIVASSLTRLLHPAIILRESSRLKSVVSPKPLPT
jgi:hypoxia up-regulated 1